MWFSRFVGETENLPVLGVDAFSDFNELRQARAALDQRILDWTRTLDPDWLESDFTFFSSAYQREFTDQAWVYVTHMFNHGTHHRGQLTAVLSQLGVDYGGVDYGGTDIPAMPLDYEG